jgi:hypothetical protein
VDVWERDVGIHVWHLNTADGVNRRLRDLESAWETPGPLKERWDGLYADDTEKEQVFPLEPKIRGGAGEILNLTGIKLTREQ